MAAPAIHAPQRTSPLANRSSAQCTPRTANSPHDVYQTKRTKAVHKHTLFGSGLQKLDEEDLKQLSQIDVSKLNAQEQQVRPGLERYKQELDEIKLAQQKACTDLRTAREKAVCFQPTGRRPSIPSAPSHSAQRNQWYKPDDLHHASEINRVGLNSRQSYNYDKYRTRPPAHKYALVGDILRPGMDFTGRNSEQSAKSSMKWSTQANPSKTIRSQTAAPTFSSQNCVVDLPMNIKHFFGTKVCNSLLSDQRVVNETLTKQKRDKEAMVRPFSHHSVSPIDPGICPSYEALGNSSRQNIFPGYSIYHKKSLAKTVYTDEVHQHRDPPPDKYRYQRDELSIWSEHNFLVSRLKKQWDEYMASLPKVAVNWDRSAKREVKVLPPEKQKPQKKAKTTRKPVIPIDQEPDFEEVVFKTPPLTPPPPPAQPSPAKMPDYVKDEEFWSFFDQPVP